MEKINELVKSKSSVPADTNNKSKRQLSKLGDKTQRLLLWSNICALWSYVLLVIVIARLYPCFEGKERFLMVGSLGTMYVLFAILMWFAWNDTIYNKQDFKKAYPDGAGACLHTLSVHSKKRSLYLALYAMLLGLASVFFLFDIHNGLTLILKISAPIGTVAFLTGVYFLIKFKEQNKILQAYEDIEG